MRCHLTLDYIKNFQHLSDIELIGDALQEEDTWLRKSETYMWYYATAAASAPRIILELGVRYGYAGIAMVKGAKWSGKSVPVYIGIDSEFDGIKSNSVAEANIRDITPMACVWNVDTRYGKYIVDALRGTCNMVHVDGDHSVDGIERELDIAICCANSSGVILVDDCNVPHIKSAVMNLCDRLHIRPFWLPTQNTTCVIDFLDGEPGV